ncbi:multidrug DMT transporter permease [Marinoscillum furvescens]|uniref:Glucose uptake protein n=1 Tax=Marinoscillum furvescens DSM 4134 TaxID=1122208 RepID=A0A3D9L3G5_MARFU|nr:multidrug DMT transporter permease [Marinoscillum furvescens]RED99730.1 glucose uptake protein [Marinoscillum furvescens DSM 4134]
MYIVSNYALAVGLCVITMLCWGSWANTQKLASKSWAFQLFYWDYAIGIVLLTLLFGFTLGSHGELGRGFLEDLQQAKFGSLRSAFLGGVIFNLANILIVIAIDLAGMAIAFPVGIGIALVQGVVINYFASPVGKPVWLFSGVFLVAVAIVLDALAYGKMSRKTAQTTRVKGLLFSLIGGVLMGFFYRFVADAMAIDFAAPATGLLTPYSALFIFSLGVLVSNALFNTWAMYFSPTGKHTTYTQYFKQGSLRLHLIGISGGVIWAIGMSLSILASGQAGYAISYGLGQGATLVAAIWGVFVWKEFKGANRQVRQMLALMFLCFLAGLFLIIISRF